MAQPAPLCSYLLTYWSAPPTLPEPARKFEAIAGVTLDSQGRLRIPHNALETFVNTFIPKGVTLQNPKWMRNPVREGEWESVKATLQANAEVLPHILADGYLFPFQQRALAFAEHREGVHLWHPTGSGKSCTGLLYALLRPGPILVITRAAARPQWVLEVQKFSRLQAYAVCTGPIRKKRKKQTLEEYFAFCASKKQRPVCVVGWESLNAHGTKLLGIGWGTVLFDESHRGKNTKRYDQIPLPEPEEGDSTLAEVQAAEARARGGFIGAREDKRVMIVPVESMASLAAQLARKATRRICTTATPVKNLVMDLWAQLDLAEPGGWGTSHVWGIRYADARLNAYGGWDRKGASNVEELGQRVATMRHHVDSIETSRHLPPKRRQPIYIPPEDQNPPSAGFGKEMAKAAERGPTAVLEVRLKEAASRKRKALIGLMSEHVGSRHKIVVLTGRRRDVDDLGVMAKKEWKGLQVWALHGESGVEERNDAVREYMAHPGPCILIGTGDSFGESLNMQSTDAAFFVQLPYTPGQITQWEGRFCRNGQDRPVIIYYVIAQRTVDEHVADILISKLASAETVGGDSVLRGLGEVVGGISDESAIMGSILKKLDFDFDTEDDDD